MYISRDLQLPKLTEPPGAYRRNNPFSSIESDAIVGFKSRHKNPANPVSDTSACCDIRSNKPSV